MEDDLYNAGSRRLQHAGGDEPSQWCSAACKRNTAAVEQKMGRSDSGAADTLG